VDITSNTVISAQRLSECTVEDQNKNYGKMRVRRPKGYVTDPWNVRMDETGRKLKKMEVSSGRGQEPEGAVAP
jgi:hypothetical protein